MPRRPVEAAEPPAAPRLGADDGAPVRRFALGAAGLTIGPLAVAPFVAPHSFQRPDLAVGVAVVVAYTGHIACSALLGRFPEVRAQLRERPVRRLAAPATLLVMLCATAALVPVVRFTDVVLAFLAWQLWHFQKQNLGLVALAASRQRGAIIRRSERIALRAAGAFGIVSLVARPGLLNLHLHPLPDFVLVGATTGYAVATVVGFGCLGRRLLERTWSGPVMLLDAACLLFFLPALVFTNSLAAVLGMAIAHGLQYLWVLRSVDGLTGRRPAARPNRWNSNWLLLACAVAGGSLLTLLGSYRTSADPMARVLGGLYLGLVCLHFVFDASVWRMRDPWARKFVTTRVRLDGGAGAPHVTRPAPVRALAS